MDTRRLFAVVTVLVATTGADSIVAAQSPREPVEGVYRLVSRKFSDGREQRPPEIEGRVAYLNGQRVAVIFTRRPDGEYELYSAIGEHQLTPTEFRNLKGWTSLYLPDKGKPVVRETAVGTVPVARAEGRVEWTFPQPPGSPIVAPKVAFDKRGFTAVVGDIFVDTYEKIE